MFSKYFKTERALDDSLLKVVYLTSGTILIGRFSDRLIENGQILNYGASQAGVRFFADRPSTSPL